MGEIGKAIRLLIRGTLVYHHCAYRNATLLSLFSDVLIVLLSVRFNVPFVVGLMMITVRVPVDPLEWQISQDTASNIVARLANTVGAAESVFACRDLTILLGSSGTNHIGYDHCLCRTMFILSLHCLSELSIYRKLCTETN
ncbi:hypothetical protein Bca101_054852 [Brassica carinata]